MKWPDFFPDDCPDEDAQLTSGEVFRVIRRKKIIPNDFKPHRETQRHRDFNQPECIVCGLSVFRNLADIKHLRRRIPAMRKKLIAKGLLNHNLGKIKQTLRPNHYTWWVPVDTQPWEVFIIVQEK